uniref:MADF domain-containing protein n=1 Tax=Timema shepardi TaxID=629360 RepID=A0A7R9G2T4_TIMSH|nr:unnamed protein product [Timema shepardi]
MIISCIVNVFEMGPKKQQATQPRVSWNDVEELIYLVFGHEILWKISDPQYKDNMKKDRIWIEIGKTINKSERGRDDYKYKKVRGGRKGEEMSSFKSSHGRAFQNGLPANIEKLRVNGKIAAAVRLS